MLTKLTAVAAHGRRAFASLLVVLATLSYVRGGGPQPVYTTAGEIVGLVADDDGLLWLEKPKPDSPGGALYALAKGTGAPSCLHRDPRLTEIAAAGDRVFGIELEGDRGAVVAIPRAGGGITRLAENLTRPAGLAEHAGTVYWTETAPAPLKHVYHVPVLEARTTLRALAAGGGEPHSLAACEGGPAGFQGELVGVHAGRLYWLDRFGQRFAEGWSAVRSVPTAGGVPEALTVQRSVGNDAVLEGGELFFTAPSEDAGQPLSYRCLRRVQVSGGEPETLTDWLPADGRLARYRGTTYCGALDGVWAVPDRLAPPTLLSDSVLTAGKLVAGMGGDLYEVGASAGGNSLYRMPLTLGGRTRAGLLPRHE
jgi:hypothetical protein